MIVDETPVSPGMPLGMGILCVLVVGFGLFPDLVVGTIVEPAVKSLVTIL